MAGESAANIAPIDATPAGRAAGSADANNSRVRSGVMPPSAKTGIAPALHAALRLLGPHAGTVAGFDSGSKTGPKTAKSAPSRAAAATSGGEWLDTPMSRSGPSSLRAMLTPMESKGR